MSASLPDRLAPPAAERRAVVAATPPVAFVESAAEAAQSARALAAQRRQLGGARSGNRRFRGLRAKAHRDQHRDRRWQPRRTCHDNRRGAGRRRRPHRPPVCRPRRAIARPHAGGDRARPIRCVDHQCHLLAPARQPHADRRRDRRLPAVRIAPYRARPAENPGVGRWHRSTGIVAAGAGDYPAAWDIGSTSRSPVSIDPVPTLPMFHPSFLLRAPERKREAWRDLLALRARLDELRSDER